MAAKRIAQSAVNWGAIAEKVGESQRPLFNSFKAKSDTYLRKVLANPEAPPAIDWAFYKQRIAVPGLVDSFQKQYEALKVPYPENKVSHMIDAQKVEVTGEIKQFVAESNNRISSYEDQLARLQSTLPYSEMTMEDYAEAFPDKAYNVDAPTFWPHNAEVAKAEN